MFVIEPLLCPCCTPAILHALSQSNLTCMPQQMLGLGTRAMSAIVKRQQQPPRLPFARSANPIVEANSLPTKQTLREVNRENQPF
ncbi:hypothetical protein HC931_02210 [Candidatus Gracilibacteria bacterium]|nr:hypothetical protein [Candidatus Gracilibacteria bacterium]NJM88434.1 hypothetical protein [Hydrococcus sp. RU_2_2]NJP19327.1 hypothetical protein [Hydrococcus sp. CRU_1_1]NJQ98234.1 hypothetical protein [Hydrococcus sp. CSU_1_8]